MLTKAERDQINREITVVSNDTRIAEFYIKPVIDAPRSWGFAEDEIIKKTKELNIKLKKEFDLRGDPTAIFKPREPDLSAKNLKRYGARQVYKDVLMVNIRHAGQVDNKSRKATEEDKITFSKAWSEFKTKKQNQGKELKLLPNITDSHIMELNNLDIFTMEDLANSSIEIYPEFKQMAINLMRLTNANTETNTNISDSNRRVREQREVLQTTPVRQEHTETSASFGGGFNYTFNIG